VLPVNVIILLCPPGLPAEPKSKPLLFETATVAVLVLLPELLTGAGLELTWVLEDEVELVAAPAQLFQVVTTQSLELELELELELAVLVLPDETVPAGTTQLLPDWPTLLQPAVSLTNNLYSAAIEPVAVINNKAAVAHKAKDCLSRAVIFDIISKPPC